MKIVKANSKSIITVVSAARASSMGETTIVEKHLSAGDDKILSEQQLNLQLENHSGTSLRHRNSVFEVGKLEQHSDC
jgi:hypothetical protein